MKTRRYGLSKHAMAWLFIAMSASLPPAAEAAFDCSTPLFGLPINQLQDWINSMETPEGGITNDRTSACANRILEDYPGLNFPAVEAGSDDAVVRYGDSLVTFMSQVTADDFDPGIADKVRQVRAQLTADINLFINDSRDAKANLPDLNMSNVFVDGVDGMITGSAVLGNHELGEVARFKDLCQQDGDRTACEKWEKSMRLILATSSLLNRYKPSIIKRELTWFKQALSDYRDSWDDYFRERRSQLPWEMALNQVAHRDRRRNEFFSRPPKYDWILLHPSLVVSLNSDESGSDEELDLVLEIFGINYWGSEVLSGVSLVNFGDGGDFLDEDRFGIVFHFGSQYSLGWADSEDDGHWFISVDLLARFDDERGKLKQREEAFEQEWEAAVGRLREREEAFKKGLDATLEKLE